MSEDDDSDDDGEDLDGDGNGTNPPTKVAGVSVAAAQAGAGQTKGSAGAHKFLPPLEVELQMQQLWKQEADVLDLIFASGNRVGDKSAAGDVERGSPGVSSRGVEDGYRVFFLRALAVPPPRFRPPMHIGDMTAEHPQNVYLTKVGFVW